MKAVPGTVAGRQFDVLKFVKRITPETAQKKKGDKLESKLNKVQK